MGRPIKKGSTDQSTVIRIIDSTDGTPENAVEHDTSGIDLWWRREKETKTVITEVALAALDSAHSDGGIELIGDGYYRLDLPDAAVAAGSGENSVQIGGTITGMIVIGNEHALVDYDPYDSVRAGLTALPNATANAAGGLPISAGGALALDTLLGRITGNVALASVVGALADVAAVGDVTEADTLMQYHKQLINILIGTAGIGAFPAEAAPANAVSLAEVIRAIHSDVTGLNGSAMIGTNSAALAANYTAARAAYLDELAAANLPTDVAAIPTASQIKTAIEAGGSTLALIKAVTDALPDAGALTTIGTDTARLTAVRAAVLTDWIDGGRLDLLLDAVKVITDLQRSVSGTVVVNTPDTIFDLTAVTGTLSTNNDAYNNMVITFFDISGNIYETRKVSDFVGASGRVTIDAALTFPVDDGVDTFILWNKYSPTAAAGGGATAQEVHEYDVSGISTPGQAGYEIQQAGSHLSR